jgi:membrane-associated protease RseP (regulator of RpoE activity)
MLGTSPTPYDLRFRFLNVPVRIHPIFWLVTAAMGWSDFNLPSVLLWIVCIFVSILVHEYGHALTAKRFGGSPSILLYGLGGLCFSENQRTPGQRLAVLFAGPGAGFVLLAIVLTATSLLFGVTGREHLEVILTQVGLGGNPEEIMSAMGKIASRPLREVFWNMVWINLWWGLVNLLPIYPLDGGQATQVLMTQADRRNGVRRGHIVSLVTAGILAVLAYWAKPNDFYPPIFFGVLAMINFQILQSLHQSRSFGVYQDEDWWKR